MRHSPASRCGCPPDRAFPRWSGRCCEASLLAPILYRDLAAAPAWPGQGHAKHGPKAGPLRRPGGAWQIVSYGADFHNVTGASWHRAGAAPAAARARIARGRRPAVSPLSPSGRSGTRSGIWPHLSCSGYVPVDGRQGSKKAASGWEHSPDAARMDQAGDVHRVRPSRRPASGAPVAEAWRADIAGIRPDRATLHRVWRARRDDGDGAAVRSRMSPAAPVI